jgi:hypothetical protein
MCSKPSTKKKKKKKGVAGRAIPNERRSKKDEQLSNLQPMPLLFSFLPLLQASFIYVSVSIYLRAAFLGLSIFFRSPSLRSSPSLFLPIPSPLSLAR